GRRSCIATELHVLQFSRIARDLAPIRCERARCHEIWRMEAKGTHRFDQQMTELGKMCCDRRVAMDRVGEAEIGKIGQVVDKLGEREGENTALLLRLKREKEIKL